MQVLQLAQQPTQKLSVSNAESSVFSNTLSAKHYENQQKAMDDIRTYIYISYIDIYVIRMESLWNDYGPVVFVSTCVCFPQIVMIL